MPRYYVTLADQSSGITMVTTVEALGPSSAVFKAVAEARRSHPEVVKPHMVEMKLLEEPKKHRATLCAPPGECEYCDRRREHARVAMGKLRDKRAKKPAIKKPKPPKHDRIQQGYDLVRGKPGKRKLARILSAIDVPADPASMQQFFDQFAQLSNRAKKDFLESVDPSVRTAIRDRLKKKFDRGDKTIDT
jgi:hypothetical protein